MQKVPGVKDGMMGADAAAVGAAAATITAGVAQAAPLTIARRRTLGTALLSV